MDFTNDAVLDGIEKMLAEYMRENYTGTKQSFELWFSYLRLTHLDGERAVFACDTSIKQNILQKNYLEFIKNSLNAVIGYIPAVEIKLDPSVAPPNPFKGRSVLFDNSPDDEDDEDDDERVDEFNSNSTVEVGFDSDSTVDYMDASANSAKNWSHPAPPNIDIPKADAGWIGDPVNNAAAADPNTADSAAQADGTGEKTEFAARVNLGDNTRSEKWLSYIKNYTFENFIVGSSNRFAHASAMNVADHVGEIVNPLFIWGQSGLGKTHLMYAIANRALQINPKMRIICIKGEEFTNQLVDAIQKNRNREFRHKYRSCDMLMIDDIQFIAGKEATQTEFFHTFDALYEDKKQIILTSDRPPRELESLEQRIRSRFEQGLLADIKQPDYELRMAILRNKIKQNNIDVPTDVVDFLAQNLQENIRQLEGVIKKLAMSNLLTGQPVNMEMVIQTVPEYLRDAEPVSDTIDRIIECVSRRYNVAVSEIMGKSRKKETKTARNVAMYVVRAVTGASLPQIGAAFDRDHSTVHSNISMIESEISSDPVLDATISEIMKEIKRS